MTIEVLAFLTLAAALAVLGFATGPTVERVALARRPNDLRRR